MRVGFLLQERRVLVLAVVAGHQRHAGLLHQALGRRLVAHRRDRLGRRADEDDAGLGAGGGEVLVLRQEAVARDGSPRRRCRARRRGSPRRSGSCRAPRAGRCGALRRPARRGARRGRRPSTPPPCARPCARGARSRGRRSRRGWRSGSCGTRLGSSSPRRACAFRGTRRCPPCLPARRGSRRCACAVSAIMASSTGPGGHRADQVLDLRLRLAARRRPGGRAARRSRRPAPPTARQSGQQADAVGLAGVDHFAGEEVAPRERARPWRAPRRG